MYLKQFLPKVAFLLFFLISIGWEAYGQTQTFNSSGSFTVPDKITSVDVQLWGAGGGGGFTGSNRGAGGGGGGAFLQMNSFSVSPGTVIVTIGSGGIGQTSSNAAGSGGNTTFGSLVANGGSAANGATGGNGGSAPAGGSIRFAGGNGANGPGSSNSAGGGGGAGAGPLGAGEFGSVSNGGSGSNGGGAGGNGGASSGENGFPGSFPGGGGGGEGRSNSSGGNGGNGQVIVIWTCSTTLTSGINSDNQTICEGTSIDPITYIIAGASGATVTGLPTGLTPVYVSGDLTISGTPTVTGTFNYTITPTGSCTSSTATGTITVTPNNTASTPSSTPTVCINTALSTNITHTTTGATGIGAPSGLPAGMVSNWAANTITISGTPTVAGTFNYSIPLTGGCGTANAAGTITVTPDNTVSSASATPTLCVNTLLGTSITHSTTGATGIGAATNLPAGMTAAWSANTITISGTPTVSGTFNYTIPLTGGCGAVNATGTITVTPDNTASAPSSIPTLCINSGLTDITITTTGATGIGSASGLPTGVSASWNSNTITISGTPSQSGVFNYTIPLTGGCGAINATGTITVTADNTVTVVGSADQSQCINESLVDIVFNTTGATGIGNDGVDGADGLPPGVSASWNAGVLTISGTPTTTAASPYNYSIPLLGGCGTVYATGTITVTPDNSVTPTTSEDQTLCINTGLTAITFNTTGATGISNDGISGANGLPLGVNATFSGNTITISGTPSVAGSFNYSIPLIGGCNDLYAEGTITVDPATAITAESMADQRICIGATFSDISVTATGVGTLSYQWFSNTTPSKTGAMPVGTDSNTFSPDVSTIGTLYYFVEVTSGCSPIATSNYMEAIVEPQTAITTQPSTADDVECYGDGFDEIIVEAVGADLTYQWYSVPTQTNSGGTAVSGATSANFTPPSTTEGIAYYYVVVTGYCSSDVSNPTGKYEVTEPKTTIVEHPSTADETVCLGGSFSTLTVEANGEVDIIGSLQYQWYSNTSPSNTGGTLLTGETNPDFTPPSNTVGILYYYATGKSDCGTVPTNVSGAFTVTQPTVVTNESLASQEICEDQSFAPISIVADGTGTIAYQWYSNTTAVADTLGANVVELSSENGASFTPPTTLGPPLYYFVKISSNCGPNDLSSISGAFIVNPLPVPTLTSNVDGNPFVCEGNSVTYTTESGQSNYVWDIPGQTLNLDYTVASGGTATSDTFVVTWLTEGAKNVTVSYTDPNGCTAASPEAVTITVNPLPVASLTSNIDADPVACEGSSVTYTTDASQYDYVWTISGTEGDDYNITYSGSTLEESNSIEVTWLSDGPKDVSVSYTDLNGCSPTTPTTNTITIDPLPSPTFTSSPGAGVCAEIDEITYTTQSGQANYVWNIPGVEGTDYTITAGGTGNTDSSVSIIWLSAGSKTVEVSYTDGITGCIASSAATSTTEVQALATVGPTSTTYPSVCISSPTLTPFTQATTGVTGIGTPSGLPTGVTAIFNNSTGEIEFSGDVTGATTGLYSYSIPLLGSCTNGLTATGTIDVTPNYEITSISSVSATSLGGLASISIYGDPTILVNGIYEIFYQIAQGNGSFTQVGPVNVSVTNGKGTFNTIPINSTDDTYIVQILSIKKSSDVCTITLPTPPTTYFGVCSAVFSANSTFYVPGNVYQITIEIYGAGGGGGNGAGSKGGGGGGYSIRTVSVTPGQPIGVYIGKSGSKTSNGGNSYATFDSSLGDIYNTSILYAHGGAVGSGSSGGSGGSSDPRYSGGASGASGASGLGGNSGGPQGNVFGKGGNANATGQDGIIIISYSCPDPDDTDCMTIIDDGSKSGYTIIEYSCDDTWTAPEGLIDFTVFVGSAGGGGGSGEGSGGGGSGALIVQNFTTTNPYGLPPATNFEIEVGEGGPGAFFGDRPGDPGAPSSFTGTIDGMPISIIVPGGGGGGSQISTPGGSGASGGGGGATLLPSKVRGAGGNSQSITYSGSGIIVYNGNSGGLGDYHDSQDAIAGGGGGGLVGWTASDKKDGKAAGNGQGEGGDGGNGIALNLGDSIKYFGAGGGGIGEYFNGAEKDGQGGYAGGIKLGGDGNLDTENTSGIGYPGVNQTGSGGGAGYAGGGKGGDGVVYIVYENLSILSVEYLYFEASYSSTDRSAKLKWATSQEWENAHFEIERSINNVSSWQKIGRVEGAGYSDEPVDYEFLDENLPVSGGLVYYRLKQVDFDGEYQYSVTRSIQLDPKNGSGYWVAYPNPSGRREHVQLSLLNPNIYHDEPILIRISDAKGVSETYTAHSPEDVNTQVNYHLRDSDHGLFIIQLFWGQHQQQIKIIRK